jgi:hypothetical protein
MKRLILLVLLAMPLTATAEGSMKDQINAACAGALLFMAGYGENVDANTRAAAVYMRRLPAHLHPAIDVAILQFSQVPVAEVRQGAKNCRQAL